MTRIPPSSAPTLHIEFRDYDASITSYVKHRVKGEIERMYGVRVEETANDPSVTVHYGSREAMRDAVLTTPPKEFGTAFQRPKLKILKRAVASAGFADGDGTARGVASRIGGDHVFLNHSRLGNPEQRTRTAVHEVGHALGLEHPEDPAQDNIMQPAETGHQTFRVLDLQLAQAKNHARAKEEARAHRQHHILAS